MEKPIIAIVGRPNVGKSTLFNRLIQKRDAIVDDVSGVTRDRHYGETDWNGRYFQIIDTGGYLPQADNEMDLAIREQVDIAMEEADAIVFVVDVRTGVTDIDKEIAAKLIKTDHPVNLVVNKIDNDDFEMAMYEFYQLGLGDPIPLSALQGRGTGDLLDMLVEEFPLSEETIVDKDIVKVAIIGRENVGKSSFVNKMISEERMVVTSIPGTTRDSADSLYKYKGNKFLLIDTAGLKRKAKVKENLLFYSQLRTMKSIDRADVVMYMVDVSEGLVRQDLRVIQDVLDRGKPVLIAFNKWDLIKKDDKTYIKMDKESREKLGQLSYVLSEYISVFDQKRLYKVFDILWDLNLERQKVIKTSYLNKTMLPVIDKTPPPAVNGKEIKIKFLSQKPSFSPVFLIFSTNAKLIPEHYKRFLENQMRLLYGFKGVPIRFVFKENKTD